MRLEVLRMDRVRGARNIVLGARSLRFGRWLSCGMSFGRFIRRSRFFGRYGGVVAKCSRLRSGRDSRLAMIHRSPLLWVGAGSLRMLSLLCYRRDMLLVRRSLLFRVWAGTYSTIAPVVADPVHGRVVDHRGVIRVVNVGDVHVVHRPIVGKLSVFPATA